MNFVETSNLIFSQAVKDYHRTDDVDAPIHNPYQAGTIEYDLYLKNWIDTVQWHLEDMIRISILWRLLRSNAASITAIRTERIW